MTEHVAQEVLAWIILGIIDGILLAAVSCLLYLPFAWWRKRKFMAYLQGRRKRP